MLLVRMRINFVQLFCHHQNCVDFGRLFVVKFKRKFASKAIFIFERSGSAFKCCPAAMESTGLPNVRVFFLQ